ncbi:SDR family oxidoreductase [Jiella endophytica]|uniref:SDR family oxidoreductase n=1 Tax=Jiella endophytica TaxID=2558362 RepID=A0A4Y8RTW0_9HYPH|nr:SDR family oxidoreductase [Jiella endophytica]TFF27690.1 SDR family oxidoreductase [Jiella endophytica]
MSSHPSLAGRVVVVTGSSRGLGREMALELAGHGALLVITGAAETPELAATAEEIGADRALALAADVCDPAAAEAVVAAAEARFGRVDVLVNNAGRGMRLVSETFNSQPTNFWEVSPEAWKTIVDINVNGAFNMARAATPGMISRGFGRIVNISTSDITMVRRGYSPYGPSKAALEAASRVWAADLAGTGVTVNVYLPGGAADTDLLPPGPGKKGADGNLLPAAIMRRAICWLASDASSAVTGARFIARNWDPALPDDEAAAAARIAGVDRPAIM